MDRSVWHHANMEIKGKIVLVTGASEGIGAAAARLLTERGAKVALAARSLDKLNSLAGELEGSFAVEADMTRPESITAMVDATIEHFGRLDVLVNNAGRALRAPVAEIKIPDFQSIIELNVYGPLLAMQAVIPHMRKQGGGSIINISSNVSKMAIPTIGAYAATKYALNGLTLTARNELADTGIVVTVMHPGLTATNFGRNAVIDRSMVSAPPPSGASNATPDTAEDVAEQILEAIRQGPAERYMSQELAERLG
jgi:NAD(P)-dependent dehydrogenase (short-subunit alcohol dehydrogenase family)